MFFPMGEAEGKVTIKEAEYGGQQINNFPLDITNFYS